MTRFLSETLGAHEPDFRLGLKRLEQAHGHPNHDIRLSVDKGILTIGGAHVSSGEEKPGPAQGGTVVNFPKGA